MPETIQRDVEEVATTEDTGNPVFKVTVGDATAHVICHDGILFVPSVTAHGEQSLGDVVDHAVRTFGLTTVKFTNVISERLESALDGFHVEHETHPQIGEEVRCLVGEWHAGGDRDE